MINHDATKIANGTNYHWYKVVFVAFVFFVAFVVDSAAAQERIAEILVHGNHTTPTEEILALAGLAVGGDATEGALAQAQQRLEQSGRFESAEVRRRFRSITNSDDILVVLLVNERARGMGLWMPIVAHRDGYGFTYGGRVSFENPLGPRTRLSVPMTWGGERRAAVEVERSFETGALTTIGGTVSISRRVNPHHRATDLRREVSLRAERAIRPWLRAGADARVSQVTFASAGDTLGAGGAHVTLDTRQDASFPRNAIHATFGAERLESANRLLVDVRGYAGVVGPVVLAVRGQLARADEALPLSEQPLVGGSDSLRGYRAGHQAGDSMAALAVELRVPITSPLSVGRFGVKGFVDAGAAWPDGEGIRKQQFDRGIGAGIFFGAAIVTGGVDVAWPEHGKPRVHASLGVAF